MAHRRREPAPGVFRLVLPLPFPGLDRVNAYLLADGGGYTLVDCGIADPARSDEGWGDLVDALDAVGVGVGEIERLVVTHHHIDHYGMAGRVVEETGCELLMHSTAAEELDMYRDPSHEVDALRQVLADHGVALDELDELTAFEDWRAYVHSVIEPAVGLDGDETLDVGDREWTVVHTPGHARTHICLYSRPDGLLISGDHLLPTITPHIDFERAADADPLGEFLASLEKVEMLDPSLVLPGHGRPFDEGAERARIVARHHDRRLGSILQIIRREPHTANEITEELFSGTLLNFHRRLALGEVLAHLRYLRKRGEIERIERGGGTYEYKKTAR